MSKHTPGEWFIQQELPTEFPGIESNVFGNCFSIVIWGNSKDYNDDGGIRGRTREEAMANARLIAAAPDLLEALIELRNFYIEMTGLPPVAANAAIAKAKGEQI